MYVRSFGEQIERLFQIYDNYITSSLMLSYMEL